MATLISHLTLGSLFPVTDGLQFLTVQATAVSAAKGDAMGGEALNAIQAKVQANHSNNDEQQSNQTTNLTRMRRKRRKWNLWNTATEELKEMWVKRVPHIHNKQNQITPQSLTTNRHELPELINT